MSDFQSNLQTPDAAKSRKNQGQSPWVLILFGVPFLLGGVIALVAGIRNPKMENVSVAYSVGGLFACAGLGIIIGGFWLRKKAKQTSALQARHPDQPWLWRADWAEGKIKSSAMGQPILMLIMGLGFCGMGGVSTGFALPEVWQKHNYAALLVLIFPLAGLGMLAAFFVALRSQRRFGDCYFELAQIPIPLGRVLEGMIQTGAPLRLEHELHLKIFCMRRVQAGKNSNEYILWQNEKVYSEQANLPASETGTGIPVHFQLPADQPECFSRGNESVFWRLEAKTKLRGPDFHAIFALPVFKVADVEISGSSTIEADDSDPTAALAASIEEIRREENSKIKISDGPNGREFYFPPARNIGTALIVTIMTPVFLGIAMGTFYLHAPIIFPIVFGLVGILMVLGSFRMWTESIRITIDSTDVRVKSHWVIFSRTRKFSANDVSRFTTRAGMQSGAKVFLDIRLIPRGSDEAFAANKGKFQEGFQAANAPEADKIVERFREAAGPRGVTVANNIASAAEANWLVAEMNKALHQTQPGANYSPSEGMGGPKPGAGPAMVSMLILIGFAAACGAGYWFWRQANSASPTPPAAESPKPAETPKPAAPKPAQPQPAALTVAFSSFGSGGECATNGLTIKSGDGHADWFVSETSGRLYAIELKIEPVSEPAKRLIVSIAQDENGVPGAALETFSVARLASTNTLGWLDLNSRQQPALKAGVKYWIDARSPGAWYWHFNNQNIVQNSMRPARRKWISAGYTNVCAFSVLIETNRE